MIWGRRRPTKLPQADRSFSVAFATSRAALRFLTGVHRSMGVADSTSAETAYRQPAYGLNYRFPKQTGEQFDSHL